MKKAESCFVFFQATDGRFKRFCNVLKTTIRLEGSRAFNKVLHTISSPNFCFKSSLKFLKRPLVIGKNISNLRLDFLIRLQCKQEALWATLSCGETIDTCYHVKGIGFLKMGSFSERHFTSVCRVKKQKENLIFKSSFI